MKDDNIMNNKFVKDNLLPNEKILFTSEFHPLKVWVATLLTFVAIALIFFVILSVTIGEADEMIDGIVLFSAILTVPMFFVIKRLFKYDEFVITNFRVIAKAGLFIRVSFELEYHQVESIEVRQGIMGRIFNYGTLMPSGVGASKVKIPFVMNPFEFRQHFYDLNKTDNTHTSGQQPQQTAARETQKYFVQPQNDGKFYVVEKNSITGEFVTIQGEVYNTEFEARKRAKELNVEYNG